MASTGLFGPYTLNNELIDKKTGSGKGAYALGYVNSDGTFIVERIGRSDNDLNSRLKDHVGNYKAFKYGHFSTLKGAFEKECHLYHDFPSKNNPNHPARPAGTSYVCPVCDIFDD